MAQTRRMAALICLLQIAATALAAGEFWFSVGPAYRGGMRARTSGSSYAQTIARTQLRGDFEEAAWGRPGGPFPVPPPPGFYSDGLVLPDSETYDPSSPNFGLTSFWYYEDASQYDPVSETLTFHSQSTRFRGYGYVLSPSTVLDRPAVFANTFRGQGLETVIGLSGPGSRIVSIDFCAGISAVWDAKAAMSGVTFEEYVVQSRYTITRENSGTAVHDVTGVAVPSAPYRGTPAGPAIPYEPVARTSDSRTYSSLSGQWEWTNRNHIDIGVNTDIYSLWIGSRIGALLFDQVTMHLTPRVSLNHVNVDVSRHETLTRTYTGGDSMLLHTWSHHGSQRDTIFGAGATAGMDWESANGFFVGLWGGYEWLSDKVTVNVGPNKVSVDVSGYTAGGVAGFRFGGK
jgi:hypothetical protein